MAHVNYRTSPKIRLEEEIGDRLGADPGYVHLEMVDLSYQVHKTRSSGVIIESRLNTRSFYFYGHMQSGQM